MKIVAAYLSTLLVLVSLDFVWLRFSADAVFRPRVGPILTDSPNFVAAGLFYVFFTAGLLVYAVSPALMGGGIKHAALHGAFLGFLAYMTFDLTCLAILSGWSVQVAVVDIAWGTFVSAVAASAGYLITHGAARGL